MDYYQQSTDNMHVRKTYFDHKWLWLTLQFLVFHYSYRPPFCDAASQKHL